MVGYVVRAAHTHRWKLRTEGIHTVNGVAVMEGAKEASRAER